MCSSDHHQAQSAAGPGGAGHDEPRSSAATRVTVSPVAPLGVAAAAVIGCIFLIAADPTTPGGATPTCPTKALFGITCPGCGASRMIYSLLHLDVVAAIQFNAVGVAGVVLLLWSWFAWFLRSFGKRIPVWSDHRNAAWWVLGILLVWTVLRLLPFEPFRSLQV